MLRPNNGEWITIFQKLTYIVLGRNQFFLNFWFTHVHEKVITFYQFDSKEMLFINAPKILLKNNLFHPFNTNTFPTNPLKLLQLTDVFQFTCVNLNCCSTSGMTVLQSRHMKVPNTSSGWTGWVRTTWPEILSSVPILAVVISRTLQMHKSQHMITNSSKL